MKDIDIIQRLNLLSQGLASERAFWEGALDLVREALGARACCLLKLDEEGGLRFHAYKGEKPVKLDGFSVIAGKGICGWVAKEDKLLLIHEAQKDPRFKADVAFRLPLASQEVLCSPIHFMGSLWGVLEAIREKEQPPFSLHDQQMLTSILEHLSRLRSNHLLLLQAKKRAEQLVIVQEVIKHINSILEPDKLLRQIMELVNETMQVEASSILLMDEDKNYLSFKVALGEKEAELKEYRLGLKEGVAGCVVQKGQPLIINDVSQEPKFSKQVDALTGFTTRSLLAVPLKVKGEVTGVIEAINKKDGTPFVDEDAELLKTFSDHIAIAIENARLYQEVRSLFLETVKSLVNAIDAKDPYTRGHSERVSALSVALAEELGLNEKDKECIHIASLLHDVGKIGIDEAVLKKPSKLSPEEFQKIKAHPDMSVNIVAPIKLLKETLFGIAEHHEKYDGSGYPRQKINGEITMEGRIIAVADAFDALTSNRPYRDRSLVKGALEEIKRCSGSQFDPPIVEKLLGLYQGGQLKALLANYYHEEDLEKLFQ